MSVTVQSIPRETVNLNEYFVPTILDLDLEKTSEDRSPQVDADGLANRQNGDALSNFADGPFNEENVNKMSPKKKSKSRNSCKQHSSFLLQPFLKPVDPHIESNKENPVLKALFGGKSPPGLSPWTFVTKTSINNCHPFKKTDFSHDLTSDDTPAEIPKSLLKKPSKTRRKSIKEEILTETCENRNAIKEITLSSDPPSAAATASVSLTSTATKPFAAQPVDGCLLNRRKRTSSQVALPISRPRLSYVNSQRLIQLRAIVDNAVKNHKIYSMTGCYNSVRNALKQRGWIEKIDSDVKGRRKVNKFEEIGLYDAAFQFVEKNQTVAAMRLTVQTNCAFAHNDQIRYSGQGEAEIMNRMLKNVTEDLCWLSRPFPYYCYKDFDKFDMINRLPRAYFSNKVGLCNSLQQIQWFYESGVCSTQFPRTYNTSIKDELQAFKDDFRITACIGLLKWFSQTYKAGGEKAVRSFDGKVELNVIEFALRRCAEFVKTKQHEDIDILESQTVWEYQWDNFMGQYYRIVNEGQTLKDNKENVSIKMIANNVQSMLNIIKPYWPQYDIEGYQNFWIVKPGGRCCGAGIVIKNHLEQILLLVNPNSLKETRYVVQKYIERPLLIYNTKFDIRQWFLVTNVYPLTVWMYRYRKVKNTFLGRRFRCHESSVNPCKSKYCISRESYLRFCSQPFTLKNTHESIHLCNNAVQKKYKNAKRDRGLPDENMWDCYTFQTYLKAIGHPGAWEKYIYPGMRESFVGALLASQDSMERKRNCFELYGADFMISDTLTDGPWLIEINSNPAMDSSTSVTARMCPQVLEDIIKVVIDRRDNKSASTGAFEMVYKQNCPPIPPYLGMSLCVKGKKAYKSNGDNRSAYKKSKNKNATESFTDSISHNKNSASDKESISPVIAWDSPKENSNRETWNRTRRGISYDNVEPAKNGSHKRMKTDWVRKNIDDIKRLSADKEFSKSEEQTIADQRLGNQSKALAVCKKDYFTKKLRQVRAKKFIRKIIKEKTNEITDGKSKGDLRVDGTEAFGKNSGYFASQRISDDTTTNNLMRIFQFCQLKNQEFGPALKSLIIEMKESRAKESTRWRIIQGGSTLRKTPSESCLSCNENPKADRFSTLHDERFKCRVFKRRRNFQSNRINLRGNEEDSGVQVLGLRGRSIK